jgi:hypothetical protein
MLGQEQQQAKIQSHWNRMLGQEQQVTIQSQ